MAFTLPELPYSLNALEPYMSASTLEVHHGKHYKAYIDALNEAIAGTPFEQQTLEQIIKATWEDSAHIKIYNNAAQAWNHAFFWNSMTPDASAPSERLEKILNADFGSLAAFKTKFTEAALAQFGSGWAWLISEANQLKIITTSNAENPLNKKQTALLVCDVWEHAYYLDYQNRRAEMVEAFLDHLMNWTFIEANLAPYVTEHPTYLS